MERISRIHRIIAPSVEAMGYELVRIQLSGAAHPVLQVMAERADRVPMGVEDCAQLSRQISALLDVEDPIAGAYTLEVSSPGIDRPLTRPVDYERFAGFEARIETKLPIAGRKRFRGRILGIEGEVIRLSLEPKPDEEATTVAIAFADIAKAKLVLSDELIAASGGRG